MKKSLWTSLAALALAGCGASGENGPVELAKSGLNRISGFHPKLWTDGSYDGRFVPHVYCSTPWGADEKIELEVPEYIWASLDGDPHNDSPFYYGRAHTAELEKKLGWVLRQQTLAKPAWARDGDSLGLASRMEGGFTITFKVTSKDNLVEVQNRLTNDSAKPLTKVRFVNCARVKFAPSIFIQDPAYSKLYADDRVISWDGAGQGLLWLNGFRKPGGVFTSSIWFRAYGKGFAPDNWASMEKLQEGRKFFLNRLIDIPAIAKFDQDFKKCLIVYSPQGREAFTNLVTPCFHGNTEVDVIHPGETKETTVYYTFFEGDIQGYFQELKKIHPAGAVPAAAPEKG